MGGTGPGTQQALHKYLMNAHARQRAFPELLPRTGNAIGVEARPAGRTIWLLGEPAWGAGGQRRGAGLYRPLGSARQRLQMLPDCFLP